MMSLSQEKIKAVISDCVNGLNAALIESEKISTDSKSILFGEGSLLDSMGLLNLLMDLEEKLGDEGVNITILDDHALSQKNSPFRTTSTLAGYIHRKMQNEI